MGHLIKHTIVCSISLALLLGFAPVVQAQSSKPHSVNMLLKMLQGLMSGRNDVRTFFEEMTHQISDKALSKGRGGILETSRPSEHYVSERLVRFVLQGQQQEQKQLTVEYYPDADILLFIGKNGLPSMKADLSGNKLLTRELGDKIRAAIEREQNELAIGASAVGAVGTEDEQNKVSRYKQLEELEQELSENTTLLPDETSTLLHRLYN